MAGMGSLYVGAAGLQSSQNALNTTAHNLTNVETTGYTRQQVLFSDLSYNTVSTAAVSAEQVGLGVQISEVRQVRDYFLDQSYRLETGRLAFYETSSESVTEVETLFGETEGVAFQDSLNELWEAMEELSKDPSSTVNQNLLIQKASAFLQRADAVRDGLKEYQTNLNGQINDQIDRINEIGEEIKDLNYRILKIESGNLESANDLRDTRNSLLDELSGLANISYSEDENGIVTVRLENEEFITKEYVNEIEKNVDSTTGYITPSWSHLNSTDVFDYSIDISSDINTDVGSLKALVLARGDKTANYTDLQGITAEEYQDTIEMSVIENVEAEFDQMIHGIVTAVNDLLCPNTTVTDDLGNTYTVWDEENGSLGADEEPPGNELFSRTNTSRYSEVTLTVGTVTSTYYVYNEEDLTDTSNQYTLGSMEINKELLQDGSKIPYIKQDGSIDYNLAGNLSSLWDEELLTLNPASIESCTFTTYYSRLVGDIASTGSVYDGIAEGLEQTTTSIDNQRQQVIGVSSDEELSNMIKYQNAYNAASRYMNVIDDMLELVCTQLK